MAEIIEFEIKERSLKVDKIEELGNKICELVRYYEQGEVMGVCELAAIADLLISIREVCKSHDERIKKLEE